MVKQNINISKLWYRAQNVIPTGVMLYSKKPDIFIKNDWPTYFSKAKKCYIWDLNNKKYTDLSFMGVGTNVLGYSNPKVDAAVIKSIKKSNMSTLNNFDEIILAEKLIEIHPWASMVKFARTGGEANSVALRIARAASNRSKVAFCGYHGWHDWFLSSNLRNKSNLNNHLMKNIPIGGVDKSLHNSSYSFKFNDIGSFKKIIKKENFGVVIMEVKRDIEPDLNFLKYIRNYTKKNGIVLIFDECTSGFRETYGGMHLKYKIIPDIAVFGKAIGNGFAINAIIGKKKIMNYAKKTFISSTFWTEGVGTAASLATLEIMRKNCSYEYLNKIGMNIKKNWQIISNANNVPIEITGMNGIPKFTIKHKNWSKMKTFLTKSFLKKKILANNVIYISTEHKIKILNEYYDLLNDIFVEINKKYL